MTFPILGLPYGQLPFYEEGNRSLNQSLAIARYLASKCDLVPSDSWDQAVLDAAVMNVYDFFLSKCYFSFLSLRDHTGSVNLIFMELMNFIRLDLIKRL